MPIITGSNTNSYGIYEVLSLRVPNLNAFSSLDYSINPTLFGLSPSAKLVSGTINQSSFDIALSIKNPEDDKVLANATISAETFSGLNVDVYSKNRSFLGSYFLGSKQTDFTIDSSILASYLQNITGALNLNQVREVFLDFKTYDRAGNQDVYHFLLNYPKVEITGLQIRNTNPINIAPLVNNFGYLKSVDVYSVYNKNILPNTTGFFDLVSGYYKTSFDYENDRYIQNLLLDAPSFIDENLEIVLPTNFVFIPRDYFSTGSWFLSSGIKTSYYDTSLVPLKISNVTGYISCSQNEYDKNLDTQAIVKWNAIKTDNALSFETYVYEDGVDNANYVYASNNPQVQSIKQIFYGTGSGIIKNATGSSYYSGLDPIFKKYSTSGIQWVDHTLFLDNYASYPLGIYNTGNDFDYITEVRIPSGYINSPELYFINVFDTGSNSLIILPSGGKYTGSVYTGGYSGARFISGGRYLEYTYDGTAMSPGDPGANKLQGDAPLGSNSLGKLYLDSSNHLGNDVEFFLSRITGKIKLEKKNNSQSYVIYDYSNYNSNAGYFDITVDLFKSSSAGLISGGDRVLLSRYSDTPSTIDYEQGVLFAKRITGNADFILSEFEPKIKFPVKPNKNYEVKVRASYQDGSFSDFSETLRFTSGQIVDAVTGITSGKFVIDGSGVSGYLAVFSDKDTITTGTIRYSGNNQLVFNQVPNTTTTASQFLVLENNILKIQSGDLSTDAERLIRNFTQVGHSFATGNLLGFNDVSGWFKANAESISTAEVVGIVQNVYVDNFDLVYNGRVTGLSSLNEGSVYFLSPYTSGAYTETEPTFIGQVTKPVLFALSPTEANFIIYRGFEINEGQASSGSSGTSGSSGSSGTSGSSGSSGTSGSSGSSGTSGSSGSSGTSGSSGSSGTSGSSGSSGTSGSSGSSGTSGRSGSSGTSGSSGSSGTSGSSGSSGTSGSSGSSGTSGSSGSSGTSGSSGSSGINGTTVSGTNNYVTKFTSTSTLGNSQIYDNATNIGIGTTNPSQKLHVVGTSLFTDFVRIGKDVAMPSASDSYTGFSSNPASGPQSYLELIESLSNAIGVNDPLRFRTVTGPEKYQSGSWSADSPAPEYKNLIDGNANSYVNVITQLEYTGGITAKRFIIDLGGAYIRPNFITIQSDYNGNFYGYSVLIEKSPDNSTYSNATNTVTVANGEARLLGFAIGDLTTTRYLRFTFTATQAITPGALLINRIRGYGNQFYGSYNPVYTNINGNLFSTTSTYLATSSGSVGIGTSSPSSLLHINGGNLRLAATAGHTPFQLYSYNNSESLWLASGNTTTSEIHLSPNYAIDFDRSVALKYVPGTTGGIAGVLTLGQLNKNNVNYTHGVTAFYTNGTEKVRINADGNLGIGTTSPQFAFDNYNDTTRYTLRCAEKTLAIGFGNGVANQKVDITFDVAPGNNVLWGNFEVEVTSGFSNQLSTGQLIKVFSVGMNPAGGTGPYTSSLYDNVSYYKAAYGEVAANWAIDGVFFNTTTGKYYITLIHRTSTSNTALVKIRSFANSVGESTNIKNLTAGSVYTTDTTVYYKPVVEMTQARIGYSGNINQAESLIVSANVGIGTTNALGKLDIRPDASWLGAEAFIFDTDGGNNPRLRIYRPGGGDATTAYPIHLRNDLGNLNILTGNAATLGSETVTSKVYLKADGNLGIGTTTVNQRLEVNTGTVTAGLGARIGEARLGSWIGDGNYAVFVHNSIGATANSYALLQYSDGTTYLNAASAKNLYFRINNADKMILLSGGNVGIGTTNPAGKLSIVPDGDYPTLRVNNSSTGTDGQVFQRWAYVDTADDYYLDLKQTMTANVVRYNFSMKNNGTTFNDVLILDRGNVGIGSTSPAYKFDVTGSGRFTSSLGVGGAPATGRVLTLVNSANTGPSIKVVDPNVDTSSSSLGARTFYAWFPIELGIGTTTTTRYIPLYT